jgi:hypothetical protein
MKRKYRQSKENSGLHFLHVVWIIRHKVQSADVQTYRQHKQGNSEQANVQERMGFVPQLIHIFLTHTLHTIYIYMGL